MKIISKGVDGDGDSLAGVAAWDGALRLHGWHVSRVDWISRDMPGQNTNARAWEDIADTPWCPECRCSRTHARSDGGTTTRLR